MNTLQPTVSNIHVSLIDSGENFTSPESPLVYSGSVTTKGVNVTVIAPFHSNAYSDQNPSIAVTQAKGENFVTINPAYSKNVPLSNVYTQVMKIDFTLDTPDVNKEGAAVINITVDMEGAPDTHSEPKRKTVIIAQGTTSS